MWLAFNDVLATQAPGWGFPLIIRIEGEMDPEILGKAFHALVERHESLRVSFTEVAGEPSQVVHAQVDVPWQFHDFSFFQGEVQRERLHHLLAEALAAPIKNEPPMFHAQLVKRMEFAHEIDFCDDEQLPLHGVRVETEMGSYEGSIDTQGMLKSIMP